MTEPAQQHHFSSVENTQSSTVVVTGANSTIGLFLIERLCALGCKVIAIDKNSTINPQHIIKNFPQKNLLYHAIDLNKDKFAVKDKVDYIFQLFSGEQIAAGQATLKVLELARKNAAKLLLCTDLNVFAKLNLPKNFSESIDNVENTPSSFAEDAQKQAEVLVTAYYKNFSSDVRIVRLLDVYGPGMDFKRKGTVNKLFLQATTDKTLIVTGDGLDLLYPTFISDAVNALLMAMFGYRTKGLVFNIFNEKEINILSFAKEIEKNLSGEAQVLMVGEESVEYWQRKPKSSAKDLAWKPEIDWQEGIVKTLEYFQNESPAGVEENISFVPVTVLESESRKISLKLVSDFFPLLTNNLALHKKSVIFFGLLLLLVLFLLFPAVSLYVSANNVQKDLNILTIASSQQNITRVSSAVKNVANDLFSLEKNLDFYAPIFTVVGVKNEYLETKKILKLAEEGSLAGSGVISAGQELNDLLKTVLTQDQSGGVSLKIISIKKNLDNADNKLSYIQSQLFNINFEKSFLRGKFSKDKIDQGIESFLKGRLLVSRARELINVLPEILGLSGKRTYLVLFSNNMELRPAGGFIGSYGILTFDKGKMVELKVEDVYSADGQLTGHVEPPAPIREYLEQPHWYLRDSNWSPDFWESAQKAEWFLDKEIGRKADGVFMLDLNTIADLISVLGPINLPDYQETVTVDNLFAKATLYSQNNFFPGSTQKKDFLGALSRRLLDKILSEGTRNNQKLLASFLNSVETKHLALYFHDEATQNLLSRYNWAGRVAGDVCGGEKDCLDDFIFVVDANLGVNKANSGVAKKINTQIDLTGSTINKTLEITYQNNNPADSYQNGRYKNYLRIYQPLNTELESLWLDGVEQETVATGSAIKKGSEKKSLVVNKLSEQGKNSFGFLFDLAPGAKLNIVAKFNTRGISLDQNKNYQLVVQKQLGAQKNQLGIVVIPPTDFIPELLPREATLKQGKIVIDEIFNGDRILNFKFKKQE